MAECAVKFFLWKLNELLSREVDLLLGVDGQIRSLRDKLEWIQAFLKDADARRRDNARIKVWVSQIRDIAYDAEDVIDKYLLQIEQQRQREVGFTASIRSCICYPRQIPTLHELSSQIEVINRRLQEISANKSEFGFQSIQTGGEASTSMSHDVPYQTEKKAPIVEEDDVVGFQDNLGVLVEKLLHGEPRRSVISIVGMGGLGKTTLAKKVYNNSEVKSYFECHAWIYVSQKYTKKELLQDIIVDFMRPRKQELAEMNEADMIYKITKYLKEMRYLLVVDDIWDKEAWSSIIDALPNEMKGSRIILTTRKEDVAWFADAEGYIHKPRLLNREESWTLFCKKAFPRNMNAYCPPELEKVGKELVARCAGLPLAVVVLGGLLLRKPKLPAEWTNVLGRISYEFEEGEAQIQRILALSYDDLPYYLRSCFLYFGLFPEDSTIEANKLIRLWVAEGFIQQRGEQSLEEVAKDYIEELISRCMIQVDERNSVGNVIRCRIHDLLLDLCISEGKEGKFLHIQGRSNDAGANAFRRLAINKDIDHHTLAVYCSASNLRSLLWFKKDVQQSVINKLLSRVKLLRVIYIPGTPIKRLPKEVGDMVHLRYLGLQYTQLEWLPRSLGKLPNLQTLDVYYTECRRISNAMWKMETLRHLDGNSLSPPKIICSNSLQSLRKVKAGRWIESSLAKLTNLRLLHITDILEHHEKALSECLEKLVHLKELDLEGESLSMSGLGLLSLSDHLDTLWLRGRLRQRLSHDQLPTNLTFLSFVRTRLEHDPLPFLERLPYLRKLQLWGNAYIGKEMVCSAGGFRQLQDFDLRGLEEWERWRVDDGAMPCLRYLQIWNCRKLEMLPDGLRYVNTLQELGLRNMPRKFRGRVSREGGDDWYKIQHVPSLKIEEILWDGKV